MTNVDDMKFWDFPSTHKFACGQAVETSERWPVKVYGAVVMQGQRSTKNKKGEKVFECNSYQILDLDHTLHYFLEDELQ
jgi:hypothetical protein